MIELIKKVTFSILKTQNCYDGMGIEDIKLKRVLSFTPKSWIKNSIDKKLKKELNQPQNLLNFHKNYEY